MYMCVILHISSAYSFKLKSTLVKTLPIINLKQDKYFYSSSVVHNVDILPIHPHKCE